MPNDGGVLHEISQKVIRHVRWATYRVEYFNDEQYVKISAFWGTGLNI